MAPRSRRCRVSRRVSTPFDHGDAGRGQPVVQAPGGAPVRRVAGELAHHDAASPAAAPTPCPPVDAVVPDHRRGHHHDLAEVARIGERLLIPGQVGGEHHFAERGIDGARASFRRTRRRPRAKRKRGDRSSGHPALVRAAHLPGCLAGGAGRRPRGAAGAGAPVSGAARPSGSGALGAGRRRAWRHGAAPAARSTAAARHQREHQREHQEDPAAPPGQLGEDGDGLTPAEHGVGGGAAEGGESPALAGLQQDDGGEDAARRG